MATLTCHDVADYFLAQFDNDSGELITNLKLQKLVYYAQGISLGLTGQPLFEAKIEAWEHGPVVLELYQRFKDFGRNALPTMQLDINRYTPEVLNLLAAVFVCFIHYPAWELRNMTHDEAPWKNAYVVRENNEITINSMKDFFQSSHYIEQVQDKMIDLSFDFDLVKIKSRVEGHFVAMPTEVKKSSDIKVWLKQKAHELGSL